MSDDHATESDTGSTKVQGVSYLRDMVREKIESEDRIRGYLTFVPAMLVRMLEAELLSPKSKQNTAQVSYQHGIVFFADISGFTKLTERLADEPNGAERLCLELDKVYALILSEADKWGGDCIKFAGDAILFCWPIHAEEGTEEFDLEYKESAVRAAKCSLLIHESVQKHHEVAGIKLTLHAGMACGKFAACLLGGCFSRWEFVIAGEPMTQIAKAEPAAKPGETVYSPQIAVLLKDLVLAEEIVGEDDPAKGYFRHRGMAKAEDVLVAARELCNICPPLQTLSTRTFETTMQDQCINRLYSFVPRYILNMMDSTNKSGENDESSALTEQLSYQFASIGRSEMREVSTIFVNLLGVDLSVDIDGSQEVFRLVQNATYAFGGSVNKLLVDDKGTLVVIVFGLPPLVHRDSPDRAIATAFLLIKLLKELNEKRLSESQPSERINRQDIIAHMGITSARTFCGIIGAEHRREFTVMGDSVNMAARLMAACSTTNIPEGDPSVVSLSPRHNKAAEQISWQPLLLVDEPTAKAASLSIHCTPLGSIYVKGKSRSIDIYHPNHFYQHKNGLSSYILKPSDITEEDLDEDVASSLVGEVARSKIEHLERAVAKLVSKPPEDSSTELGPTVMMICGEQGFGKHSVAKQLVEICPRYNIVIACSTPSTATHNMYQDGLLDWEAEFTSFRGPLLSMLTTLHATQRLPKYVTLHGASRNNEEISVYRAARAVLPKYLHRDVPLLSMMYPEMKDDLSFESHISIEENEVEDTSPLFKDHVAERIEELHGRLNRDMDFKVTIVGEMDGNIPTPMLGRQGDEAQEWTDAGMEHAYLEFIKVLEDSLLDLYTQFPDQVSFGEVSSEAASATHYQVWSAHALNWNVGDGKEIGYKEITTQKDGVFGIVTSPKYGPPSRDIDEAFGKKTFNKNKRSRLIKLLVAIITRCFEMADNPSPDESSPPFKFLIVIEHAHTSMGYRSWEIVNALRKIGAQGPKKTLNNFNIDNSATTGIKMLKRMSTSEAMATAFASTSRPLMCMVTRPLKRFAATPEYFQMMEVAAHYDTLIQIKEMSETDTDLLLRRCIAKRLWKLTQTNGHSGTLDFEIASEMRRVKKNFSSFEDSIRVDVKLLDFTWDSTHGCPFEIIAMSENLVQSDMLSFEIEEDDKLYAKVKLDKSLDTMQLSHVLKSSVISRFHAILDEKPFIWSHIVRLASCFQAQFSPSMLCHLLKSMKNSDGESCNLNFPEHFITHMIEGLVECSILIKCEKSNEISAAPDSTPRQRDAYEFRSKLVCHALRETLLQSQLNVNIDEEFQAHCEPILRMHRLSHSVSGSGSGSEKSMTRSPVITPMVEQVIEPVVTPVAASATPAKARKRLTIKKYQVAPMGDLKI